MRFPSRASGREDKYQLIASNLNIGWKFGHQHDQLFSILGFFCVTTGTFRLSITMPTNLEARLNYFSYSKQDTRRKQSNRCRCLWPTFSRSDSFLCMAKV